MKIGRNEPCPCGSGRKYKHCCERAGTPALEPAHLRAQRKAHEWLKTHFRAQLRDEEAEYFAQFEDIDWLQRALDDLDPGHLDMLGVNVHDWLLCETPLTRKDVETRGLEHVLNSRDLRLLPDERAWLEALADAPLALYEITAVEPGRGLSVRDLSEPDDAPEFVREVSMTRSVAVGDVIGMRLIELDGEPPGVSGALYPLDRMDALELLREVEEDVEAACDVEPTAPMADDALDDLSDAERDELMAKLSALRRAQLHDLFLGEKIHERWLDQLLRPSLPRLVTGPGREPLRLIEDDYDVLDAQALADAMKVCADVIGDAEHGWARLEEADAASSRSISAVNPGAEPGVVTLFHRSQAAAELGREWFLRVAGPFVRHRARRETDPAALLAAARGKGPNRRAAAASEPASPEIAEAIHAAMRRAYANWCDVPIPVLGDRAPRALLGTREGRDRVRFLLRSYELAEAREAPRQGRPALSHDFLWRELGLEREESGG